MQHAKLSPSSSSRWLTCTASVEVVQKYENTSNGAADWGTCVHEIGEYLLKDKEIPKQVNGFNVDEEMIDCALDYANYVRELITPKSVVLIEERFDLSSISENQFGTGDATVLNDRHLHIVDLKTGHNLVNAKENTQLMLYAIGAIDELETIYEIEKITLHIVQSRINHYDTWELSYDELMVFKRFAKEQANKIITGNTTFNPSEKACKWCPHQANCEALIAHVEETVKGAFDDIQDIEGKADIISNEHLKRVLDNKDLITSFIKAVEQVALERLQNGQEIDGYKLVESRTNRKWVDEEEVERYLKSRNDGIDYYQAPKLKAMGEILKTLKGDKEIEKYLIKPAGAPTVAPISDKREPLTKVCDEFDII